jgi:hypothetical protein
MQLRAANGLLRLKALIAKDRHEKYEIFRLRMLTEAPCAERGDVLLN